MNTPRRERRTMSKDETMKGSAFNPAFVQRIEDAIFHDKADEELHIGTANLPGHEALLRENQQKTLAENVYRGPNAELVQRIAAASEMAEMNWDERGKFYRDQVEARVKADEAKEKALVKGWKTKEQEYENIMDSLSNQTY